MASLQSKMMEGARSSERLVALALYGQHWPWVNMHETTTTVGDGDICISLARARGVTFSSFVISLIPTVMAMDSSSLPTAAELEQCTAVLRRLRREDLEQPHCASLRSAVMALTDSSSVEDLSDAVEGMKLSADLNVDSKQGGGSGGSDAKKAQKSKGRQRKPPLAGNRAVDGGVLHLDGRPVDSSNSGKPPRYLVKRAEWKDMPDWIVLQDERGKKPRPFPSLADDPLFRDGASDGARLLSYLPPSGSAASSIGAAIICPGGNYEFLHPREGSPVARWAAEELGIPTFVLKYGLLPACGLQEMQEHLACAVREARKHANGGPVVACGFSAGGHLIASSSTTVAAQSDHACRADLQLLVYPCINPDGWLLDDECGFWRAEVDTPQVRSLVTGRERLRTGKEFVVPPPTFLVSSTDDWVCPPDRDGDPYAAAIKAAAGGSVEHLRGSFGDHGFGLKRFWAEPAAKWLRAHGVGTGPGMGPGTTGVVGEGGEQQAGE